MWLSALVLTGLLAACTSSNAAPPRSSGASTEAAYGSLPTFLPSTSLQPDSVLTGSVTKPALTSEGDAVVVHSGTGSVVVTVSGPDVPGEGLPYQSPATTCTFHVTFASATTATPISIAAFNAIDHLGEVYQMTTVPAQPPIPASVAPGQSVTFELRAVMPTGEGLMRWAPDAQQIVASWDFVVEND
jgi:hypothetical protein